MPATPGLTGGLPRVTGGLAREVRALYDNNRQADHANTIQTAKQAPPVTRPEAIRGMIDAMLHILSKDTGEKPAQKAK